MPDFYLVAVRKDIGEYAPIAGPFPNEEIASDTVNIALTMIQTKAQVGLDFAEADHFDFSTLEPLSEADAIARCRDWFDKPPLVCALYLKAVDRGIYQGAPGVIWMATAGETKPWPWRIAETLIQEYAESMEVGPLMIVSRSLFLIDDDLF